MFSTRDVQDMYKICTRDPNKYEGITQSPFYTIYNKKQVNSGYRGAQGSNHNNRHLVNSSNLCTML
jgi:hypothetical protein